ncbi:hypothetical protein [uncultured Jatrophihabitans sp.]|uniref:hypothetical protein n=1 Tax=uncultured Jatrophihabitans sp. TaxID=1610747 RepID=UPI0035CBB2D5
MTLRDLKIRATGLRFAALPFAVLVSVAFLVIDPPVGDYWAARARSSAAAHGVGLHYWFAWFGGTVPGHYSVLTPYVSKVVQPGLLGAASTIAVTALVHVLARGTRHPVAATWTSAIATGFSLWSGRVPFAFGSVFMLVALLCVRANRPWLAGAVAALTALVSPVSGAFLALGVAGVLLHDRRRRLAALAAVGAAGVCLLFVVVYFATPGPEGFQPVQAWFTAAALAAMLLARPPDYVRTVVLLALVACPIVALVPNGLGSNFERFAWIVLPAAVVATSRAGWRVTAFVAAFAVSIGIVGSAKDLWVAAQPMSEQAYVAGLVRHLDSVRGLDNYRVETVPDGTHVAAYALLGHAQLARGFETQADNAYDSVLASPRLDAARYRRWLDDNAVGYVAIDHRTLKHGPEDTLVRSGRLPYLHRVWSDGKWELYAVTSPRPIVATPATMVRSTQAQLTVAVPAAGVYRLKVRWSTLLDLRGPAGALKPDGKGWTQLHARRPGRYVLSG